METCADIQPKLLSLLLELKRKCGWVKNMSWHKNYYWMYWQAEMVGRRIVKDFMKECLSMIPESLDSGKEEFARCWKAQARLHMGIGLLPDVIRYFSRLDGLCCISDEATVSNRRTRKNQLYGSL